MKSILSRDYLLRPLFILVLCLFLGALSNLGLVRAVFSGEKKLSLKERVEATRESLPRISIDEASEAFMRGDVLFVDARDQSAFEAGHIPRAMNLPWEEAQYDDSLIVQTVPREMPVITYCDGSDCESSILLGGVMAGLGYEDVRVFFGGWVEWEEAGFPVEEGIYE
jgi:3-mercaptopyruvate sulfurtransferase SseA